MRLRHPVRDMMILAFGVTALLTVLIGLLAIARPVHATSGGAGQPPCTGDRHYDGVGCCPAQSSTTTTTLPLPSEECGKCPSCPLPAPCPTVTCEDGQIVYVDRCPDVVFPMYRACKERPKLSNGACKKNQVAYGGRCWKCPRPRTPLRGFIPFAVGSY